MRINNINTTNYQSYNQANNIIFQGKLGRDLQWFILKNEIIEGDYNKGHNLLENLRKIATKLDKHTRLKLADNTEILNSFEKYGSCGVRVENKSIGSSLVIHDLSFSSGEYPNNRTTLSNFEQQLETLRNADQILYAKARDDGNYAADISRNSDMPVVKRLRAFLTRTNIDQNVIVDGKLYSNHPYSDKTLSFRIKTFMYNIYTRLFNKY